MTIGATVIQRLTRDVRDLGLQLVNVGDVDVEVRFGRLAGQTAVQRVVGQAARAVHCKHSAASSHQNTVTRLSFLYTLTSPNVPRNA